MKKIITIFILLTGVLTLSACQSKDIPNTMSAIEDRGFFIVGLDATFAPMGFKDEDGNIVGFDVDLAKEVANRLDLEIKFQPIDWDSKVLELNAGNIDMIWNGLTITDSRLEEMSFSDPYLANSQIIMVQKGSSIDTINDLIGKSVGIQLSSAAQDAIENSGIADDLGDLIKYDDYNQALLELKNGLIDAVIVDEILGRYMISQDEDDSYQVAREDFGEEKYGIGFRLEATDIRDAFNTTLAEMIADGGAAEISTNWFNEDILYKS